MGFIEKRNKSKRNNKSLEGWSVAWAVRQNGTFDALEVSDEKFVAESVFYFQVDSICLDRPEQLVVGIMHKCSCERE